MLPECHGNIFITYPSKNVAMMKSAEHMTLFYLMISLSHIILAFQILQSPNASPNLPKLSMNWTCESVFRHYLNHPSIERFSFISSTSVKYLFLLKGQMQYFQAEY